MKTAKLFVFFAVTLVVTTAFGESQIGIKVTPLMMKEIAQGNRIIFKESLPQGSNLDSIVIHDGFNRHGLQVGDELVPDDRPVRLSNASVRAKMSEGEGTLIVGFFLLNNTPRRYLIRAAGPSLYRFGVRDFIEDPALEIHTKQNGEDIILTSNDNWSEGPTDLSPYFASTGAFPFEGVGSRDAALIVELGSGGFSAVIKASGGGVVLIEVYDLDVMKNDGSFSFINLSARGKIQPGEGSLILGFVARNSGRSKIMFRASGPSLSQFGIEDYLPDPYLILWAHQGNGTEKMMKENNDWQPVHSNYVFRKLGAFPFIEGAPDSTFVNGTGYIGNGSFLHSVEAKANPNGPAKKDGVAMIEMYRVEPEILKELGVEF